jgi:hypothetical protein
MHARFTMRPPCGRPIVDREDCETLRLPDVGHERQGWSSDASGTSGGGLSSRRTQLLRAGAKSRGTSTCRHGTS